MVQGKRLSDERQRLIQSLEQAGYSHRRIAREVQVNRNTVKNVLEGKLRGSYGGSVEIPETRASFIRDGIIYPDMGAENVWCNECRAWIKPPCLACQVRRIVRNRRRTA